MPAAARSRRRPGHNLTGPPATARPTAIPLTAIQNARSQDVYRHEIFGFQADCKDCRCLKQESFDDFAAIRAQKVRASLMLHHAQTPVLILSGLSPSFAGFGGCADSVGDWLPPQDG